MKQEKVLEVYSNIVASAVQGILTCGLTGRRELAESNRNDYVADCANDIARKAMKGVLRYENYLETSSEVLRKDNA